MGTGFQRRKEENREKKHTTDENLLVHAHVFTTIARERTAAKRDGIIERGRERQRERERERERGEEGEREKEREKERKKREREREREKERERENASHRFAIV